jgi:hypothetical protein
LSQPLAPTPDLYSPPDLSVPPDNSYSAYESPAGASLDIYSPPDLYSPPDNAFNYQAPAAAIDSQSGFSGYAAPPDDSYVSSYLSSGSAPASAPSVSSESGEEPASDYFFEYDASPLLPIVDNDISYNGNGGQAVISGSNSGYVGASSSNSGYAGTSSSNSGYAGASSSNSGYAGAGSSNSGYAGVSSSNSGYAGASSSNSGYAGASSSNSGYVGANILNSGFAGDSSSNYASFSSSNSGYAGTSGQFVQSSVNNKLPLSDQYGGVSQQGVTTAEEDVYYVPASDGFSGQNFAPSFGNSDAWSNVGFGPPPFPTVVGTTIIPSLDFSRPSQQGEDFRKLLSFFNCF